MTARRLIPRIDTLLVGFLTLFALALRLLDLGARALLPDESSSFYFSQLPLATLLWSLCDPHPPGYYLLLRSVAALGEGETWLRLPSALAVRRWLGSPWLAAALLGLVLALGLLGALPRLYTVKRHLNALLPFISIAAAWALLHTGLAPGLARRAAAGGAVGLLLALSLAMLLAAPQPAWPQLVETLAGQLQDGDAIWVDELDAPVFAYYWRERSPWQPLRVRDLDALNRTPGEQRVWLVGSVTAYRDLRQTLPPAFAAKRVVGDAVVWRDAALTAYDGSVQPQPVAAPPLAMVWGLAFQSPLEVDCRP